MNSHLNFCLYINLNLNLNQNQSLNQYQYQYQPSHGKSGVLIRIWARSGVSKFRV